MEKLSSEVMIYLQNLKHYFDNNDEVRSYFIINQQDKLFYNQIAKISQLNFNKTGQPMLTVDQFELVRVFLISFGRAVDSTAKGDLFVDYNQYGKFFLN